jgi:hypothetical protein
MALNKDVLGAALWTRVKSIHGGYTPGLGAPQDAAGLAYWTGIADEIITHFKANAVITINTFSATAPGVTVGPDPSGNITGSATGGISS